MVDEAEVFLENGLFRGKIVLIKVYGTTNTSEIYDIVYRPMICLQVCVLLECFVTSVGSIRVVK